MLTKKIKTHVQAHAHAYAHAYTQLQMHAFICQKINQISFMYSDSSVPV